MLETAESLDRIPSLPQVLLKILDAIHSHTADYQTIAEIIRQDAATAARLISVANSTHYGRGKSCDTIERALMLLGTETVKIIVITASIKQFFSQFGQQHSGFLKKFWRRSLINGNLAQVIASLTSYSEPNEAYLCGMLMDVGELLMLVEHQQAYLEIKAEADGDSAQLTLERERLQTTHDALGGLLVDHWKLSNFMADSLRYHHEAPELIQDAHHLVKIINVTSYLSEKDELTDTALEAAHHLFGLNEALTRELRSRIDEDVTQLAASMDIDISEGETDQDRLSQQTLGHRLGELGELSQINLELWQAENRQALQQATRRAASLTFGIPNSVLFLVDPVEQALTAQVLNERDDDTPDFHLALQLGRSLISDAVLHNRWTNSTEHPDQPLAVIDRQILRYCGTSELLVWPLMDNDDPVGALVLGIKADRITPLMDRAGLVESLCRQMAKAISSNIQKWKPLQQESQGSNNQEMERKIREAVHEASNPLSIIRNYLELLRNKLGDDHNANDDLGLIREEIDRVGQILLRLKEPGSETQSAEPVDLNRVISGVGQIFKQSILSSRKIQLKLNLDEGTSEVTINDGHLKQIITNLLKNAAEAMENGGEIQVTTDSNVSVSGKSFVGITIEDNGPGIPKSVMDNLFSPVETTKGGNHSGLGLSIVKTLVDEMDGSIMCRSGSAGTQFQILLPK